MEKEPNMNRPPFREFSYHYGHDIVNDGPNRADWERIPSWTNVFCDDAGGHNAGRVRIVIMRVIILLADCGYG